MRFILISFTLLILSGCVSKPYQASLDPSAAERYIADTKTSAGMFWHSFNEICVAHMNNQSASLEDLRKKVSQMATPRDSFSEKVEELDEQSLIRADVAGKKAFEWKFETDKGKYEVYYASDRVVGCNMKFTNPSMDFPSELEDKISNDPRYMKVTSCRYDGEVGEIAINLYSSRIHEDSLVALLNNSGSDPVLMTAPEKTFRNITHYFAQCLDRL